MDSPDAGVVVPSEAGLVTSDAPRESEPSVSEAETAALGSGNRAFAFDLYRALAQEEGNLFLSPYSISIALAMTYAGAEDTTESEMRTALHFDLPEPGLHAAFNAASRALAGRSSELAPDSSGDGFQLNVVNQAWGQVGYPFLASYLDTLAVNYGAGLYAVNFVDTENTRSLINQWVEDQTESRIKDLLPSGSLTSDTRLVLTNAIYFKGSWLSEFDPDDTEDGTFHAPAGDRSVPMMRQTLEAGSYAEGANYQAVALPYLSPAVRMLVILPAAGQFDSVMSGMNEAFFEEVRNGLSTHTTTVTLPKFSFESERQLKVPLSALGMPTAFAGAAADFSGLAQPIEELWIDEVYHKAFVAVDEEGTEAAASTAVVIVGESVTPLAEINVNRPFLFAVYDEPTGQILFLGHLLDTE